MTDNSQQWIAAWRRAGPALEEIQYDELRAIDHRTVVAAFDNLFAHLLHSTPAPTTSGLIAQQQWFARLRDAK